MFKKVLNMNLWECENENVKNLYVETNLIEFGEVIGNFSTLYSEIYTLRKYNNIYIAKAPKINPNQSYEEIKDNISKFIFEINHIYSTCNFSLIIKFGHAKVIGGVPFLIFAKRHMTLRDAIEEKALSDVDAISVAYQVVCALEYCALKNIVCHQDLKPENIFLDRIDKKFVCQTPYPFRYQAYLADLGIANAALIFNRPWGSRPYMPLEQYNKVNFNQDLFNTTFSKVDIFALGVNLYEMLTGGMHPIGERTSDIWPRSILGNKWGREEVWKKWASKDIKIKFPQKISNKRLLELIEGCLQTDSASRPDYKTIKSILLEELNKLDLNAFQSLNAYVNMLMEAESLNSSSGWPHMEGLVKDINQYFENL